MQKVLITGCGIGKKMGMCEACNLDFTWLFFNASTMLWADKICMPKDMLEPIINAHKSKRDVAVSIMLQVLKEHGLLDLLDDDQFEISPSTLDALKNRMANDVVEMKNEFPDDVKINEIKDNDYINISINDQEYCIPYIGSIYASLLLAEEIGAHCLFNNHTYTFLKYKSGLDYKNATHKSFLDAYNDVFSFVLPNEITPPGYVLTKDEKCNSCENKNLCVSDYEKKTKEYITKVLSYRNYDELYLLRSEVEHIVTELICSNEELSSEAIKQELKSRQQKINSIIHRRFEQVKRWTKFATICSIPATMISVANANLPAAITSAAITGVAQLTEKAMEIYESKRKWVGFLHLD